MMCSIFESAAFNFRETDDLLNPVGAACATGVIYKITAVRRSQASQQRVAAWSPRKLAVVAGVHHERPSSTLTHKPASSCVVAGPEDCALRWAWLGRDGRGWVVCDQERLITWHAEELPVDARGSRGAGGGPRGGENWHTDAIRWWMAARARRSAHGKSM